MPPGQSGGGGFFSNLFELTFSRFVTLTFAKVIYVIAIVLIVLYWLFAIVLGFSAHWAVGLPILLLGWIPALFYIILTRVGLELAVAMVRTAENTTELVQRR